MDLAKHQSQLLGAIVSQNGIEGRVLAYLAGGETPEVCVRWGSSGAIEIVPASAVEFVRPLEAVPKIEAPESVPRISYVQKATV